MPLLLPHAAAASNSFADIAAPSVQVQPGRNVGMGKDYTLFSLIDGVVVFEKNNKGNRVKVVPADQYIVPEGQQLKEGSRADRRRKAAAAMRAALAEAQ